MTEERLREVLRRAVPDAPFLDPGLVTQRARRQSRSRAWVTAACAAAVLVIAAGPVVLTQLDGDDRVPSVSASGAPGASPTTTTEELSPYDPPTCPAQLPDAADAVQALDDLGGVVAVRLCPDLDPRSQGGRPSAEQLLPLEDADALVHDLAGFTAALRTIPTGLPDYCAKDDTYIRSALLLLRADGTQALLTARGCELLTLEGRSVHVEPVRQLYLDALERQRSTLAYTRAFDDELACTSAQRGGPVRPGRERLVAAIACDLPDGAESIPDDLAPIPFDATQLADLDRAWGRPGAPLVRGPSGEHECLDVAEPPSFIIAATDRSDVVQLIDTPCGFLAWHGWLDHRGATIPTTFAALRLEQGREP